LKQKDILDEMTKEEIIHWVRGQVAYMFYPPKKSDLLFSRWQKEEKKVAAMRKANIDRGKSLNMAKRDEYAKQFNLTKDIEERLALLKKMEPYERKFQEYLFESKKIMGHQDRVDKIYQKYEVEREKEIKDGNKRIKSV